MQNIVGEGDEIGDRVTLNNNSKYDLLARSYPCLTRDNSVVLDLTKSLLYATRGTLMCGPPNLVVRAAATTTQNVIVDFFDQQNAAHQAFQSL